MKQESAFVKKLLVYFKGYRKDCLLGPLFKLLEAALELAVPLVVADIINRGIAEQDKGHILKMGLLLAAMGLCGLVLSVVAQYFAARASAGFVRGVKSAAFAHIGKLSYADLDRLGSDTLITRMTGDAAQVQTGLNLALRLLLRSPFVVFGAMILAFTVDAQAAWPFAVTIPLLLLVVFALMLFSLPLYKRSAQGLDKVTGRTRETLAGVRVIRAFCKEEEEKKTFDADANALSRLLVKVGRLSALMNPLTYVIVNAATLLLIYTGALRVDAGALSQGELVALYNYMAQILVELLKLASLVITITRSLASASRIAALLEVAPSMTYRDAVFDKNEKSDEAVVFEDVSLRYAEGGDEALTALSFSAKPGETVGIIGPTGAGKSSLVNLIPRFYDASAGRVLVAGRDVKDYDETSLRRGVGVVPQKALLFAGTIRSNLAWGDPDAANDDAALYRALEIAQVADVVKSKGGLDAVVEAGGKNFSGGQRQRLTIARALVANPAILILDDASSALDYATDAALQKALGEALTDTTVFTVSQRASGVMHADKILVMEDGVLVGVGTSQELLASCPLYREIYETQFPPEKAAMEGGERHA